jgi:hypothetical protein
MPDPLNDGFAQKELPKGQLIKLIEFQLGEVGA